MTTARMPQTHLMGEALTVGQVADELGVTVRTLHHYDELGLLTPSARSSAGYRLYTRGDLERLGTIVGYRRLGFSLDEVAELLRADGLGRREHLQRQRASVRARLAQMTDLVDAIDRALEAEMADQPATTEDLRAIFGDGYREEDQAEAEQRWGDTPQWEQSQQRTKHWTPEQWREVKAETETFEADLASAMDEGVDPASPEAGALAERHRESIARFYDCDHAFQVCLAQMYLEDERFRQHYEDLAPGLAQWLHDAIVANAERAQRA